MIKDCGIYCYKNKINNKRYIGQSIRISKRINEHNNIPYYPSHKDYNAVIHKAIRKYGINNFEISILELCSPELLNEKEQYWIKYYDSFHNGYNQNPGGNQSHKQMNPYGIYDLNGKYLKTIYGSSKVIKELNISRETFYSCLSGRRQKAKNYLIVKCDENGKCPKEIPPYKRNWGGKRDNSGTKIGNRAITVFQYSKDNIFIKEWPSATEAGKKLSIDRSLICKASKDFTKTAGGFRWRRDKI